MARNLLRVAADNAAKIMSEYNIARSWSAAPTTLVTVRLTARVDPQLYLDHDRQHRPVACQFRENSRRDVVACVWNSTTLGIETGVGGLKPGLATPRRVACSLLRAPDMLSPPPPPLLLAMILAVLSASCVIVPKTVRTESTLWTANLDERRVGKINAQLTAVAQGSVVDVALGASQRCKQERVKRVRVTETEEVDLWAPAGSDPWLGGFGVIFLLLSLPVTAVSAVVTPIYVAVSTPTVSVKQVPASPTYRPCPARSASVPVEFTLPSGAVVMAATDATGRARLFVPPEEPAAGNVLVRASVEGLAPVAVGYSRPP